MSLTMLAFGLQGAVALPFGMLADAVGEREMLAMIGVALGVVAVVGGLAAFRLARRGQIRWSTEVAIAASEEDSQRDASA